jgi:tripartite-type tricarboxylate transporter receptor subunit TctC
MPGIEIHKPRRALARLALAILAGAAWWAGLPARAQADAYPSRPIRLIVPFEAGGTSDTTARMVAQQLDQALGVRVLVDNRAGANGAIGAAAVAKAPADGYTLLHTTPAFVINPHVSKTAGYDVFKDFVPITNVGLGTGYIVVIAPQLPARTLREFVDWGRASRKGVAFSSPGIGNALHLATEMFVARTGLQTVHVPFKGTAPALNAVASGEVDLMILPPTIAHPMVQAGKVRAIGFTGAERSPDFPQVPTMKEGGLDNFVIVGTWLGWFAPAGTPAPVVERLAQEIRKIVAQPDVKAAFAKAGFAVDGRPPAEFAQFVRSESQRFGELLKTVKIE